MGYVKYDKIPISVFPVPGGPNKRIPLGGERRPVNISGLSNGKTTISLTVFFTKSNPAISFQSVGFPVNKISEKDDYYVQGCHGITTHNFGTINQWRSTIHTYHFVLSPPFLYRCL